MADLIEGIVKDDTGVPVQGAKGYVYADGVLAALKDALGAAVANPMVADINGYFKAYVTFVVEYTIKWNWLGRERYVEVHRSDAGLPVLAAAAATSAAQAATSAAAAAANPGAKSATTTALIAAIRNNGFFPQPSFRCPANDVATITVIRRVLTQIIDE